MANLIQFDGLSLPNGEIQEAFVDIENIAESEAGTSIGTVTKLQKLVLNISIKCDGHLYERIKAKGRMTEGILSYKGVNKKARLRVSGADFEKYSEEINGANGLWTVSFTISEV